MSTISLVEETPFADVTLPGRPSPRSRLNTWFANKFQPHFPQLLPTNGAEAIIRFCGATELVKIIASAHHGILSMLLLLHAQTVPCAPSSTNSWGNGDTMLESRLHECALRMQRKQKHQSSRPQAKYSARNCSCLGEMTRFDELDSHDASRTAPSASQVAPSMSTHLAPSSSIVSKTFHSYKLLCEKLEIQMRNRHIVNEVMYA